MAKGEGAKHTACRRGTKVTVKLRNGEIIEDRFLERRGNCLVLEAYGRIKKREIRQFFIRRKATNQ